MGDNTKIEWANAGLARGASWNPIQAVGNDGKLGWHCVHASEGCRHCYAESLNMRLGTGVPFKPGNLGPLVRLQLNHRILSQPVRWAAPRGIFVCSMTDLFGEWLSDEMIAAVYAMMALTPRHRYIVVTKRAARMRKLLSDPMFVKRVYDQVCDAALGLALKVVLIAPGIDPNVAPPGERIHLGAWPLQNVAAIVSAEDQDTANKRVPELLATPAVIRGVSAEPLLGPIDFRRIAPRDGYAINALAGYVHDFGVPLRNTLTRLDWIIVGGESGPHARDNDFSSSAGMILAQCSAADVPYFGKQDVGKRALPSTLAFRQFPKLWEAAVA